MEAQASGWYISTGDDNDTADKSKIKRPKRRSFVKALESKYSQHSEVEQLKYCKIVFHGKPKSDDKSELGYLRNVVLTDSNIAVSGLTDRSLRDICPHVVDLDISGNLFENWKSILTIVSQLNSLKYLNVSRNPLKLSGKTLEEWTDALPAVENLVLNGTNIPWSDVLKLAEIFESLKELHICGNGYSEIPDSDHSGMNSVETLRLNDNKLENWYQVWKLKHLPRLKSLILSGNPLQDVFFHDNSIHSDQSQNETKQGYNAAEFSEASQKRTMPERDVADQGEANQHGYKLNKNQSTGNDNTDRTDITDNHAELKSPNNHCEPNQNGTKPAHDASDQVAGNDDTNKIWIDTPNNQICTRSDNSNGTKTIENQIQNSECNNSNDEGCQEIDVPEPRLDGGSEDESHGQTDKADVCDTACPENAQTTVCDEDIINCDNQKTCKSESSLSDYVAQQFGNIHDITEVKILDANLNQPTNTKEDVLNSSSEDTKRQIPMDETDLGHIESKITNQNAGSETVADNHKLDTEINEKEHNTDETQGNSVDANDLEEAAGKYPLNDENENRENLNQEKGCTIDTNAPTAMNDDIDRVSEALGEVTGNQGAEGPDSNNHGPKPFQSLENICLSETKIGKWKHLTALSAFPALTSIRIKDVKLGARLTQEDRRKLFVPCLPKIKILNGSEVTVTEREKGERYFLRYFSDKPKKPHIYSTLEKKHGTLTPLMDIDINRGYQEFVTLTFVFEGQEVFRETVSCRQPVGKLRLIIAENLSLYASLKNINMYHKYINPEHQSELLNTGELEQLVLDTLPISRFDILDGDEIHIDLYDKFTTGALKYIYVRNYLPKNKELLDELKTVH